MAEHQIVKPQKLADTAVGMLEQELLLPNTFVKHSVDKFKGTEDDTISFPVEGVLPGREYAWRNDRSQPITFDLYSERKIAVSFGGNFYSGVKVTDEQNDFDLKDWGKLLRPQVKAVSRKLGRAAVAQVEGAPYAVTIGNAEANLRGAIIEARRVLNQFNVPDEQRWLVVGSNFESALLNDEKLNLAQNIGDDEADSILKSATISNRFGFKIVVDDTINADSAYAYVRSAFVFLNAAPSVPGSIKFGATQSYEGVSMRWVRDYDPAYMQERSVVNTYAGFDRVKDVLVGWDGTKEVVSTGEHFVRGIKLTLDGSSDYPEAGSELATMTGVSDAKTWTPTGRASDDAATGANA